MLDLYESFFAAHATLKGLFARVHAVMFRVVGSVHKQFTTHRALFVFPKQVVSNVILEGFRVGESEPAKFAFLDYVSSLVLSLMPLCFCGFFGNSAIVQISGCTACTLGQVATAARHRKERSNCFFVCHGRPLGANSTAAYFLGHDGTDAETISGNVCMRGRANGLPRSPKLAPAVETGTAHARTL